MEHFIKSGCKYDSEGMTTLLGPDMHSGPAAEGRNDPSNLNMIVMMSLSSFIAVKIEKTQFMNLTNLIQTEWK